MSNLGTYFRIDLRHGLLILEPSFNRRGCLFQKETERKKEKKLKKTKQNKEKLGYIQSIWTFTIMGKSEKWFDWTENAQHLLHRTSFCRILELLEHLSVPAQQLRFVTQNEAIFSSDA